MLTYSRRVYRQIVKEQKPPHVEGKKGAAPVRKNRFGTKGLAMLNMVEVNGFEPMTSCVQGRRSPS